MKPKRLIKELTGSKYISKKRNYVLLLLFLIACGLTNDSRAQSWLPTVDGYIEQSKTNPPSPGSTFFIGSSTWTQWGTQLEEDFADYKAVNRGFGGSRIPNQLAYMDSLLMPYAPARVLFFCGTNDVASGTSPDSVLRDFKTFLGRLWTVYPETQVYFVSVPHAPSRKKHWDKGDALNRMVRELAVEDEGLIYVDIVNHMYDAEGKVREELYKKDRLHMNRSGQEVWIPRLKNAMDIHPIVKKSKRKLNKLYKNRREAGILPVYD